MAHSDLAPDALDVLVLGSGVAGLSAAVRLAAPLTPAGPRSGPPTGRLRVGVLTKAELSQSATRWAQGGVAAVLGGDEDSTDLHLADTLAAGAGLCDPDAVRVLVDEGPSRVNELIAMGAVFDRQPGGALALAREGGHSTARVVHAGGAATGAEVERALVDATRDSAAAVMEEWFALDLLVEGGRCHGVVALSDDGRLVEVRAARTVLATGGAGQLFAVTTNPAEATADGLAMALRAGVPVADVEFMQFHPTALHHPAMPRPLLSEALRGHGALLRDADGERFVDELAPRDVVSRAMAERMRVQGVESLWLDATGLTSFEARFPTISASLRAIGLDPACDWLPIAPAAHYLSGGVVTDLSGATALPGLWAAGEVACTGVHGANRLASNSLLEGMVFGARLAESILAGQDGPEPTGVMGALHQDVAERVGPREAAPWTAAPTPPPLADGGGWPDVTKCRDSLQRAMIEGAGVVRSRQSLDSAGATVDAIATAMGDATPEDRAHGELANLVTAARSLLRSASVRHETRGAHARSDFPEASDRWRRRIVHDGDGVAVVPGPTPSPRPYRPLSRAVSPSSPVGSSAVDPPRVAVVDAVSRALAEDLLPLGDLTASLVPAEAHSSVHIVSRSVGVVAGRACAVETFSQIDPDVDVEWRIGDGGPVGPGDVVAKVRGNLRSILTAERTVLNFLGHLSGVASLTRRYVDTVAEANPDTRVLDTRKTTPGLRALEKAAVRAGGGYNHRGTLSDAVLVKDNHLDGVSITDAVARARHLWPGRTVEVECDRPDQVDEAVEAGATLVMLDNMSLDQVAECVMRLRADGASTLVEVSGGVDLAMAPLLAAAGADLISVGALTHSAPVLDLGFDLSRPRGGRA